MARYCGMKYKILFFTSICVFFVSMSAVYIFRYLREIIKLKHTESGLIIILYSLFSTNIILAFTTDSYPVSLFLLSFFVLYFSRKIADNKQINLFSYMFSIIAVGGVTITNGLKSGGVILFSKGTMKSKIRFILVVLCVFLILMFLTGYEPSYWYPHNKALFLDVPDYNYWEKLGFFFGMPILLGKLCMISAPFTHEFTPMIFYQPYEDWWQFVFVILVLVLILFSALKNYKEKLMQYLLLLFFIDVFLHVVFGLGLHEAMIYGAHWIYLVPLFIGWLFKSVGEKQRKGLMVLLCCMIIVLAVNNAVRMMEFTSLALEYFPKSDSMLN